MGALSRYVCRSFGLLVFVFVPSLASGSSVRYAVDDVLLQILPNQSAPEIYNLDKDEVIVPLAKLPPGAPAPGEYEAVEAQRQNGQPLLLWFKKDPTLYKDVRIEDLYIEVQPKWKTDEATVFSLPGKSHLDCAKPAKIKPCIAWPKRGTQLKFLNAKLVESIDPSDQIIKWRLFYRVSYAYKNRLGRNVSGTGWILAEDVIAEERRAQSVAVASPAPQQPPPTEPPPAAKPPEPKTELDIVIDKLSPHIGECVVAAGRPIRLSTLNPVRSTAFSETLLKHWRQTNFGPNGKIPEIEYKGKRVTNDQWIAIDALARTIYGEMATCNMASGSGYLMAVAKVILNRVQEARTCKGRRSLFMCSSGGRDRLACNKLDDASLVNDITHVIVKPYQFSVWNNNRKKDLRRVLCPSGREREQRALKAGTAVPAHYDIDNWRDSFKIAVEAILDEEVFKQKTSEVTATYYVSGAARIGGMVKIRQAPTVLGQHLSKGSCIKFMKPAKASVCKPIESAEVPPIGEDEEAGE
ncbi:MAG TPA: hypothetical protein VFV50_12040 [Bdellovibrionales bacterium]|nr:hypothetical protein [Bdellovibrionales bacterium]